MVFPLCIVLIGQRSFIDGGNVSSFGPYGSVLCSPSFMGLIETKPFLDMTRVRGHHYVRNTEKVASSDARYLQAVEVFTAHLQENTLQGGAHTARSDGSESIRLDFGCHEERVPASCQDRAVEGKTINGSNHAPVLR